MMHNQQTSKNKPSSKVTWHGWLWNQLMCLSTPCQSMKLLLLLLSHFSCVRLCATPEMAAHQAPPSLGFSRQEHWSGLPFPSPMHESEEWKWSPQSCLTLSDPMDCSLPGSCVHGIFLARVLEWGAITLLGRTGFFALANTSKMKGTCRKSNMVQTMFSRPTLPIIKLIFFFFFPSSILLWSIS